MLRYAVLGLIVLLSGTTLAQQPSSPQGTLVPSPAAATVEPSKLAISPEEQLPGDHWTFEVRDEVAGTVGTQTNVVTEVTPTNVRVRYNIVRADRTDYESFGLFDRSRHLIRSGSTEFVPYFGLVEIEVPLTVGKTWTFEFKSVTGRFVRNWTGSSKVAGQEAVKTKAGTFEAFRIETTASGSALNDPTLADEFIGQTWYAPAIANWVKRSSILRRNNRLMLNDSFELVEFGRRQ
jgi:hypothetical protein